MSTSTVINREVLAATTAFARRPRTKPTPSAIADEAFAEAPHKARHRPVFREFGRKLRAIPTETPDE